ILHRDKRFWEEIHARRTRATHRAQKTRPPSPKSPPFSSPQPPPDVLAASLAASFASTYRSMAATLTSPSIPFPPLGKAGSEAGGGKTRGNEGGKEGGREGGREDSYPSRAYPTFSIGDQAEDDEGEGGTEGGKEGGTEEDPVAALGPASYPPSTGPKQEGGRERGGGKGGKGGEGMVAETWRGDDGEHVMEKDPKPGLAPGEGGKELMDVEDVGK
ncbi:hypothetical protein NSK_006208, partial [Nannochloropsis salina CCMP1776]